MLDEYFTIALLLFIVSLLPLFHNRQRPGVSSSVFRKVLMTEIQGYYQRLDNFSFYILELAIVRVNLYEYLYVYIISDLSRKPLCYLM